VLLPEVHGSNLVSVHQVNDRELSREMFHSGRHGKDLVGGSWQDEVHMNGSRKR
jgi:hypothetical protein